MAVERSVGPKILAIDDSELALEVTRSMLEDAGFQVITMNSALGASAAIVKENPALVLCDMAMPALSGDRLIDVLRKNKILQNTRIVLYSDRPIAELEQAVKRCGADGYIQKTGDPQEFIRRVHLWLAEGASEKCLGQVGAPTPGKK